jgi:hypothetical protein
VARSSGELLRSRSAPHRTSASFTDGALNLYTRAWVSVYNATPESGPDPRKNRLMEALYALAIRTYNGEVPVGKTAEDLVLEETKKLEHRWAGPHGDGGGAV